MKWKLPARQPFSLPAVVRSHGWIRLAPFSGEEEGTAFRYVIRIETGEIVALHVTEASGGVQVAVDGDLGTAQQDEISRQVRWMLGLDQDLSEFYAQVRSEPKLAHVIERAQGRLLRSPTLFEDTIKTILTTNTAWGGTIRMTERLVSTFGDPLLSTPSHHAFPTPERLAATDEETLRTRAGLGYRAPYVLALARAVTTGDLDLESYKTSPLSTPELRKALLAIKGVGDYAAAHLLMLLERYDWVPVDSWAMKMVAQEWHGGQPVGRAEVEAAFERWGRWKGLAYWFWNWTS
ncbi:MAG: DNA-3-methyladenine glycosylase 2 [Anaerolineae bacterium]|nr:DNA-3-methyladenine glycosylase 2 [Anaerolineae bacterium]